MVAPLGQKHVEPCKRTARHVFRLMFLSRSDEFWMIYLPDYISKDPHSGLRRNSSQSGSDFANFFGFRIFAKSISLISPITVNWTLQFFMRHFQKVVIRTEELRRSDSLWDELPCQSGSPGLPAKTRETMWNDVKRR